MASETSKDHLIAELRASLADVVGILDELFVVGAPAQIRARAILAMTSPRPPAPPVQAVTQIWFCRQCRLSMPMDDALEARCAAFPTRTSGCPLPPDVF